MSKFSNLQILLLCMFLSSVFFIFDAVLPLGVAGGVPYIFVILISLFSHQRKFILLAAIVTSILTIVGIFLSPSGGEFWQVFINRCFALFAIWSTALLGVKLQKTLNDKKQKDDDFHKIFELSPDIIGKGTIGGKFSEVNSAVIKILGYTKEEFLSTPFIDFVHTDDTAGTLSRLDDALKNKRNIIINNRYRCADGNYKWLEWNVLATSEKDAFYAIVRDVTERIFSRRKADSSNKRLAEAKKTVHTEKFNRRKSDNIDSLNGSSVIDKENKINEGNNKVTTLLWSQDLTIDDGGIIDEDHQRLFNIFSKCQQLTEDDDDFATKMQVLIKKLTFYTVEHFDREELAMKISGYPYTKNHSDIHQLMVKELNVIVKVKSLQETRQWILTYLSDWLVDHIMVMDKALESYIKLKASEVQRSMTEHKEQRG